MIHIWQSSWEQSVDGWAAILLAEPTKFEGTVSYRNLDTILNHKPKLKLLGEVFQVMIYIIF
jgi:hypothetical protein